MTRVLLLLLVLSVPTAAVGSLAPLTPPKVRDWQDLIPREPKRPKFRLTPETILRIDGKRVSQEEFTRLKPTITGIWIGRDGTTLLRLEGTLKDE
jgi:hypothetical protein